MKRSKPDYGRLARYIANSINMFHSPGEGETVLVQTIASSDGKKFRSFIASERRFHIFSSPRKNGNMADFPVPIGTIAYLHSGDFADNEEDSMESLVSSYLRKRDNELGIHDIRTLSMMTELSGERR